MANFTPDDIFKAAFGSQNPMVPNDALWRKIEKELLETAKAKKQKKRNNRIAFAGCFLVFFLAAGGYISLQKTHPNAIADAPIAPVQINDDVLTNNTPTKNTQKENRGANKAINNNVVINSLANITASNKTSIFTNSPAILNNAKLPNLVIANTNTNSTNTYGIDNANRLVADIETEELNNVAFNTEASELNTWQTSNKNNHITNLNTTKPLPKVNSIIKPISQRGHVSKGVFVGANATKGYDNKLGYGMYVQHQKHISTQVALTTGIGLLNLPTAYKYTKVAYKEGLPTQLDAKLYELNMAYIQMGVTYYPKALNKQKPNVALSLFAMPAIITNVKATTNASNPEIDRRMERQINRTHFMAGASISKNIAPRLWLDAGATLSFSTLTNGVFLNKTNAVNNVMFTQIGLKYKIR